MEDKRTPRERTLMRGFAGHRLERPLLALVYEQLWPVVGCRRVRARPPAAAVPKAAVKPRRVMGG